MHVLITGVSGLLGANLALQLTDAGHQVTGVYHSFPVASPEFTSFGLDLTAENAATVLANVAPDAIVHTAAATNVDACETDPAFARAANVASTRAVALAARASGARLIHISTDAVFDGASPLRSELDETCPLNVYAATKLEAEHVALSLGGQTLVLRTNIYGWNAQAKNSLAEWMLGLLRDNRAVPGFTDSFYSPVLANDLADAIAVTLAADISGVLHLAGSERMSKYDFAVAVAREFGLDSALVEGATTDSAHLKSKRPADMSLDCSLAASCGLVLPDVAAGLKRFNELEQQGWRTRLKALAKGRSINE